jgi:hypothetical protein
MNAGRKSGFIIHHSSFDLVVHGCKSRTTFCATSLKYKAAALCTHAHAKAVSLSPAAVIGLKGPLHVFYTPL